MKLLQTFFLKILAFNFLKTYFEIVGLQKNCINSTESSCIFFIQLPLMLTSYIIIV